MLFRQNHKFNRSLTNWKATKEGTLSKKLEIAERNLNGTYRLNRQGTKLEKNLWKKVWASLCKNMWIEWDETRKKLEETKKELRRKWEWIEN